MPELTRKEKLKLIEKLPQRLQEFLYSEDTGAFLLYLGEKYNLDDDKISLLSKLVGDIILKITPITSLVQEIADKITTDHQAAMAMAQELNNELLLPALSPAQIPMPQVRAPAPPQPAAPRADKYREPVVGQEIVDLRKTPPPPMPAPVAAAPAYIPPKPKPLTFTKPVEKAPLIEAEPHKIPPPAPIPQPPKPASDFLRPQYIIRPPGLAPTDLPHDVLDLRKDKGEF